MVARIPIPIMKSFQFRSKFHVAVFVALLALGAYAILNKNVHEREATELRPRADTHNDR